MRKHHPRLILTISLLFLLMPVVVLAQNQPGGQMRDPLAHLKHALSDAGAPALSTSQEQQLNALISAFRAARRAQTPDTTLQAARRAYETAILNSDNGAALTQADNIVNEIANITRKNLNDKGKFEIDVLNVIKSNDDQIGALLKRIGSAGVSHLLASLSGPEGFAAGQARFRSSALGTIDEDRQ